MKKCPFCAENIMEDAIKCRYCKAIVDRTLLGQYQLQSDQDKLHPGWILLIWGMLFVPYIGIILIILISGFLYYYWKNDYPNKARSINMHGWLAVLVTVILWLVALVIFTEFLKLCL